MLKGILSMTTDYRIANAAMLNGHKILVLSEEPIQGFNLGQNNNIVPATVLLPPYPSVMAELDNDINTAYSQYIGYLNSREPNMFICAIIAALLKGINIVILVGANESEMKFIDWFFQYMSNSYGIHIQTNEFQFWYNKMFNGVILADLYGYDLIGYMEFFIRYPATLDLPKKVIPKLVMEMNPYVSDTSEIGYLRYFETFKNHIKENNNQPLINPLIRG